MWQVIFKDDSYIYYRNEYTGFMFSITQVSNGIILYSEKNSPEVLKNYILNNKTKIDYYDVLETSNTVLEVINKANSIKIDYLDNLIKLIQDHEWFCSIRPLGEFLSVIKGLKKDKALGIHDIEVLKIRLYERFGDILSELEKSTSKDI